MIGLLLFFFTFVEWNCENLFDVHHDEWKQDKEFLPDSYKHWTANRYWSKLSRISQGIMSCSSTDSLSALPDILLLTEIENDSVMHDLTTRSILRSVHYKYVMTDGPDLRGIDIALLYSPFAFRLINHNSFRIKPLEGFRPTRDILYVSGEVLSGDTLHIFGIHAPSRSGGERLTRPYRMKVARRLCKAIDSLKAVNSDPMIIVAGDFNDYSDNESMQLLLSHGLEDVSSGAVGSHGAKGTYRYKGEWGSLDHILCNARMASALRSCVINDAPFLLTKDKKHGGVKPRRTYLGPRYMAGFSDHLPLIARFEINEGKLSE